MEAKELRIGNLFKEKYTGEIIRVIELTETATTFSGNFKGKWQAEPIPLTYKEFKRLGFGADTETLSNAPVSIMVRRPLCLRYLANEWQIFIKDLGGYFKIIKYVHQLQNLYFALTGRELSYDKS